MHSCKPQAEVKLGEVLAFQKIGWNDEVGNGLNQILHMETELCTCRPF